VTGFGLGGCFALSLVVALDHFRDPVPAGALSALMQGGGFLLAACPPLIVSTLHDWTGGFSAGWTWQIACIAVAVILTMRLAPKGYAAAMRGAPKPAWICRL
jgi:CP family cyanate transporter-like MFS transporter